MKMIKLGNLKSVTQTIFSNLIIILTEKINSLLTQRNTSSSTDTKNSHMIIFAGKPHVFKTTEV